MARTELLRDLYIWAYERSTRGLGLLGFAGTGAFFSCALAFEGGLQRQQGARPRGLLRGLGLLLFR